MKIDIYNSERYYDPTPYVALNSILNQEEAAIRRPPPAVMGSGPLFMFAALIQEMSKKTFRMQDAIAVLRWKTELFRLRRICSIRSL